VLKQFQTFGLQLRFVLGTHLCYKASSFGDQEILDGRKLVQPVTLHHFIASNSRQIEMEIPDKKLDLQHTRFSNMLVHLGQTSQVLT